MTKIPALCLLLSWAALGDNLIKNPNFETPLGDECRVDNTVPGHCSLAWLTEDFTWNKCAKLELLNFQPQKDGNELVAASVAFGGDKDHLGFPVKPNTRYKFSAELKGTAKNASFRVVEWTGTAPWKDRRHVDTSVKGVEVPRDWQKIVGDFKTGPDAAWAALTVLLWWDTQHGPMPYKVGDYLLVDNVVVEELVDPLAAAKGQAARPANAVKTAVATLSDRPVVVDGKLDDPAWQAATLNQGLHGLRPADKATMATEFMVLAGADALFLSVKCHEPKLKADVLADGDGIWNDDALEVFFGPVAGDRKLTQLALAAGGGRYQGNGDAEQAADYDAKTATDSDGWTAELRIPYQLLGWAKPPVPGESVAFNLCRQRKTVNDLSTWADVDGSFHDVKNYGRLIVGSAAAYVKNEAAKLRREATTLPDGAPKQEILKRLAAAAAPQDFAALAEALKHARLGDRKFVVTPVSPTLEPSIPLVPAELAEAPEKVAVRAAVNDLKSVPFAITNLTDKLEEYRVVPHPGGTYKTEAGGLRGVNGTNFPDSKIKLLRGVRVKDRDGGKPVQCFDPLVPLDDAGAVAAPPNDSALVWLQFDCRGVKPGKYSGFLRVIPLSEPGTIVLSHSPKAVDGWENRTAMLDLPVELEVLPFELPTAPVIPWDVMRAAYDEASFTTMAEQGVRYFQISSWAVRPSFKPNGELADPGPHDADQLIKSHLAWAKKLGIEKEIRFNFGLGCYPNFMKHFGGKPFKEGSPEWRQAWTNQVKEIAKLFERNGVPLANVHVEIVDEIAMALRGGLDRGIMLEAHRLAKEAAPTMGTYAWLDCETPPSGLDGLTPCLDVWGLYGALLPRPDFQPLLQKLRTDGKQLWMYRCDTSVNSDLYSYYRRHAWLGYQANVAVIGFFVYADANDGGWASCSWKMTPSGGVVYRSGDKLVTSIRNECLKIGNQDIKYLDMLKKLAAAAKTKGADVAKAESFLPSATERMLVSKAHDKTEADKIRDEAIDLILPLALATPGR